MKIYLPLKIDKHGKLYYETKIKLGGLMQIVRHYTDGTIVRDEVLK